MISIRTPGMADLTLTGAEGRTVRSLDVGYPNTRAVATARPGQDGTDDRTAYTGARVVTLALLIEAKGGYTRKENRDLLAARCHPGLRSELLYDHDLLCEDGQQVRILIRGDQGSAPVDNPRTTEIQVSWVGYTGLIESADEGTATIEPPDPAEGEAFDWSFPVTFPAGGLETTALVVGGTTATHPTLRIDGPCTGPAVWCGDQVLSFPGLEIGAGQWLDIDTTDRTVVLNGVADRRFLLDFTVSTWWALQPGPNALRFDAEAWSAPAAVTLTWRDAYLL